MKQSGFTLVELAVALIIIGLIASAVVAGKEVIEASRNSAIIREISDQTLLFISFSLFLSKLYLIITKSKINTIS
jgi:prepilin-type N-terminal cleavage/methylation domain-containing protein